MTNADRIRSMTDEELAQFLCNESSDLCANCDKSEFCNSGQNGYLVWLKEEADSTIVQLTREEIRADVGIGPYENGAQCAPLQKEKP